MRRVDELPRREMIVEHYDCNGKRIEDISQVVLPKDLANKVVNVILESKERRRKEAENGK
ncbi:hypothetical protein D922_01239 [Enterococcus faecalis 06-MB-DW-09]|nr:hypothetical protein D922_01239 [Enterococcus faecalis 06-MB-DW-09]